MRAAAAGLDRARPWHGARRAAASQLCARPCCAQGLALFVGGQALQFHSHLLLARLGGAGSSGAADEKEHYKIPRGGRVSLWGWGWGLGWGGGLGLGVGVGGPPTARRLLPPICGEGAAARGTRPAFTFAACLCPQAAPSSWCPARTTLRRSCCTPACCCWQSPPGRRWRWCWSGWWVGGWSPAGPLASRRCAPASRPGPACSACALPAVHWQVGRAAGGGGSSGAAAQPAQCSAGPDCRARPPADRQPGAGSCGDAQVVPGPLPKLPQAPPGAGALPLLSCAGADRGGPQCVLQTALGPSARRAWVPQ
jgi:hypothetical protein